MAHKIKFSLSTSSIDKAIKELEAYKKDMVRKTELLRGKIAEQIAADAQNGFTGAIVDDLTSESGGPKNADVNVTIDERGDVSIVIANGEDAVWAEFGTGVYHNGGAGSSLHPKGSELGMTIGSYGKGMGKKEMWGFYEDGELKLTRGAPTQMPLYRAVMNVMDNLPSIAKEIWGD